jgi:hypothetical protein
MPRPMHDFWKILHMKNVMKVFFEGAAGHRHSALPWSFWKV